MILIHGSRLVVRSGFQQHFHEYPDGTEPTAEYLAEDDSQGRPEYDYQPQGNDARLKKIENTDAENHLQRPADPVYSEFPFTGTFSAVHRPMIPFTFTNE